MPKCIVCENVCEKIRFGKHSCEACAAFFRRSVALKLKYQPCKNSGNCSIVNEEPRKMCKSCRLQKCLNEGMLISQVQNQRDSYGKRKRTKNMRSDDPQQEDVGPSTSESGMSTSQNMENSSQQNEAESQESDIIPENPNESLDVLSQISNTNILDKILNGYQNLKSLRKAAYLLLLCDETNPRDSRNDSDSLRPSNLSTSKKLCKIECRLVNDMLEQYFYPFNLFGDDEKESLCGFFYERFTNTDRAYRTYKEFGSAPEDDRFIMQDGGYVRLGELETYFEHNEKVKKNPMDVAKIFKNTLIYCRNVMVEYMKRIEIKEIELCALFGMFLWQEDIPNVSNRVLSILAKIRDKIVRELHEYYEAQGLAEVQITLKMSNLLLLIPKIENSVRMLQENFKIVEIFNIIELEKCCQSIC